MVFRASGVFLQPERKVIMFITCGGNAKYFSGQTGLLFMVMPGFRIATTHEAAECVNRMVVAGDSLMGDANDEFNRIYGNPLERAA